MSKYNLIMILGLVAILAVGYILINGTGGTAPTTNTQGLSLQN